MSTLQLWHWDLRYPFPEPQLSPQETERYQKMKRKQRRQQFLCGRYLLQQHAQKYYTASKAPQLFLQSPNVSLSHSNDHVLLATTETGLIGCDIETKKPLTYLERLVERFCTPQETNFVYLSETEQSERFLKLWTIKESYLKTTQLPTFALMSQVDINPDSGELLDPAGKIFYWKSWQSREAICSLVSSQPLREDIHVISHHLSQSTLFQESSDISFVARKRDDSRDHRIPQRDTICENP